MRDSEPGSRDFIGNGIIVIAMIMFVGAVSLPLTSVVRQYVDGAVVMNPTLTVALLLNVALILFLWRRQHDLRRADETRCAAESRADHLAQHDDLTSFLNRRGLIEQGGAMLNQAVKRNKAVALLMIDLDHFKIINDLHGHAAGDAVLRKIAEAITSACPSRSLQARLGGDEFATAFIFDPARYDTVDRTAERLVSALSQTFLVAGISIRISGSIGVARSDLDAASIASLTRCADIAMYAAKKAGRNGYVWFNIGMERELDARNQLELGLRKAIPNGEIVPYFEQQIDLLTGKLTGFEVLARWNHPRHGLIMPEKFIAIAEETGLIGEMSLSILRQAFVIAKDWESNLKLSVNISPTQLNDNWLAQKIIKTLTETGYPASRLEIEITETALFDNLALAQSIVLSLKNQGISVALDDFGTGYSSLSHLRALPFDRIKIDRSFVAALNESADSAAIVSAIIKLGESLNIAVTAEGIKDAAIEARLRSLGCEKGQGYLYGLPMSGPNTRRFLAERRLLCSAEIDPGSVCAEPGMSLASQRVR